MADDKKIIFSMVNVSKTFPPHKQVLKNIYLSFFYGAKIGIIGLNGSGKSTLFKVLAGELQPSAGEIRFDGNLLSKKEFSKFLGESVAYAKQDLALNSEWSGSRHLGRSQEVDLANLSNLLKELEIEACWDLPIADLTRDQRQLVGLTLTLLSKKPVLLLDEPLSALDAKVRTQLRDEIRRIQLELGTTTLFVTHDQEEALGIADRVGVMRNGLLEQIAAPAELYDRPATSFVAEFVGLTNQVKVKVTNGSFTAFGSTLKTLPGSLTSGDGTALIRPEALTVKASKNGDARVVATSFLGSICRVMVSMSDGSRINAQMESQDASGLHPGTSVEVTADKVSVFVK